MPWPTPKSCAIVSFDQLHDRSEFDCGKESLNRYLNHQIGQDAKRNIAAPFVLVEKNHTQVLGYYTLSAIGVDLGELPEPIAKKMPKHKQLPATLLGRLAVDVRLQGKGFGEFLLLDAMKRTLAASESIASTALIVDAIDEGARRFYQKYDFIPFPTIENRLFLMMSTIAKLKF